MSGERINHGSGASCCKVQPARALIQWRMHCLQCASDIRSVATALRWTAESALESVCLRARLARITNRRGGSVYPPRSYRAALPSEPLGAYFAKDVLVLIVRCTAVVVL